jgi:Ca2+-binding RTX toxin-like protein
VTVSLNSGQGSGGTAQGDTLHSIENLTGSFYGDFLHGNARQNLLRGLAGDDMLFGYGGTDVLEGGDGDDVLVGGLHPDMLDGGAGNDTASYSGSPAGVTVVLMSGGARLGGDADGDEFSSIENLTGSSHDDALGGDEAGNVLLGHNGHDALKGYGGDDRLDGGDGADRLSGGGGADSLRGGADNDTFVFSGDFGHDIILDVAPRGDDLQFDRSIFKSFDQVLANSAQVGSDVVITIDADRSITLENVRLAHLVASDFAFV